MRTMFLMSVAALAAASIEARAAGGAYATSPVRNAAACARLCADDGLCIAWSFYQDNSCALRATAPAEPSGVANGLSHRAAGVLRLATPEADPEGVTAPAAIVAPPPVAPAEMALAPAAEEDDTSRMLLGGLEEDLGGLRN